MNRAQVLAELQALKLTSGQYVVVGGAALAIRDIRDTDDIVLVVTSQLFDVRPRDIERTRALRAVLRSCRFRC